jgi:GT2 family glycosyltransferase
METLSAVIPTLGGECLEQTLAMLNGGSQVPDEVLVCVPEGEEMKANVDAFKNVRVVRTEERGQVAQRARGFREAVGEFVLQLDDDVTVDESCLKVLVENIEAAGEDIALAPFFLDPATGNPLHRAEWRGFFRRVNLFLMNGRRGYQPGTVTLSGHSFGPEDNDAEPNFKEVEWLSGGCVLHRRTNLFTENYFPFAGKAYCEDLIHSFHLRERGVRLGVCRRAKCYTEGGGDWGSLSECYAEYRARKYYLRLIAGSWIRLHIWYLAALLRSTMMRVTGK